MNANVNYYPGMMQLSRVAKLNVAPFLDSFAAASQKFLPQLHQLPKCMEARKSSAGVLKVQQHLRRTTLSDRRVRRMTLMKAISQNASVKQSYSPD